MTLLTTVRLPDGYPLQPQNFSNPSSSPLACAIDVAQNQRKGHLQTLFFTLSQGGPWAITSSISLVSSALELAIQDPAGTPIYELTASGLLKIGSSVLISAILKLIPQSSTNPGWLEVTIALGAQTGNDTTSVGSLLSALTSDSNIAIPSGCPINLNSIQAACVVVISFAPGSSQNWVLKGVQASVVVDASAEWAVGPSGKALVISKLRLEATIADLDKTTNTKSATFLGVTAFQSGSTSAVAISAILDQHNLILSVDALLGASVDADSIISKYTGQWKSRDDAPALTGDTGLSDYGSKAVANATLKFLPSGNSYIPDSLKISIKTGSGFTGWSIVDGYLLMKDLELSLNVTNLSGEASIFGQLAATLQYQSRNGNSNDRGLTLTARQKELSFHVDLTGCNFAEMVYVATAGRFKLPGSWWPSLHYLDLQMNWFDGVGSFTAVMEDCSLPGTKAILAMINPRLSLNVSRATTKFAASGQLAGEARMFDSFNIPVTYDLPDGMYLQLSFQIEAHSYRSAQDLWFGRRGDLQDV